VKFVDLFSGAGGLSLGFTQAGWECEAALDSWEDAIETYHLNFPQHRTFFTEVSRFAPSGNGIKKRSIDWIIGGPPCQGFSTVGKRERDDPRNRLVIQFARLVKDLEPRGFLIENVVGLRDMRFVTSVCDLFKQIGYDVDVAVLRSADFGVPQLRHRIFFVGNRLGRSFEFPEPVVAPDQYVTVWDAIGDLPELEPGESKTEYAAAAFTQYQRRLRKSSSSLQGHEASSHPPSLIKAISFIRDGGNRRQIPPRYQPRSGFHNSYSRLHSASPAVAVTQNMGKPSGSRCIHPFQNRGLTAREGARLQGFPDRFHFCGGVTSQRLQIANAVSPILAKQLASALADDRFWGNRPARGRELQLFSFLRAS
jgi:DNA (cytosine-5)-methyltransferase 1